MDGLPAKRHNSKPFCACASQTPNWLLSYLDRSQCFQQCFWAPPIFALAGSSRPAIKKKKQKQKKYKTLPICFHMYETDPKVVCWVGSMSFLYPKCSSLSLSTNFDDTRLVLFLWNKSLCSGGCSKLESLVVFIPGHWLGIHMLFVFGKWQYLQKLIATAGRTETRLAKTCVGNICCSLFFFAWRTVTSYRKK